MGQNTAIEYRGCTIQAQAYESGGGRWGARALVSLPDEGWVHQKWVPVSLKRIFDTEHEAYAHAALIGRKWIDDNI